MEPITVNEPHTETFVAHKRATEIARELWEKLKSDGMTPEKALERAAELAPKLAELEELAQHAEATQEQGEEQEPDAQPVPEQTAPERSLRAEYYLARLDSRRDPDSLPIDRMVRASLVLAGDNGFVCYEVFVARLRNA